MSARVNFRACAECLEAGYRAALGEPVRLHRGHDTNTDCESTFVWTKVTFLGLRRGSGKIPTYELVARAVRNIAS